MKALEIPLDEFLGFGVCDLELAGEGVRPLAVNRCEIDRLRPGTHLLRHLLERDIEDEGRCLPVNVAAGTEGLNERGIIREMRQQAQLDLRVVGGNERPPAAGDEASPDVPSQLSANRDVLKIRFA